MKMRLRFSMLRLLSQVLPATVTAGLLFACSASASAQTLAATVQVGINPAALAVNPTTNQIYVANCGSNTITVIDGQTNATTTIGVGNCPHAVTVNPATNRVYVANSDGSISVIDGATNAVVNIVDPGTPGQIAVNSLTDKIYVANTYITVDDVGVIDGATNSITTLIPPELPCPLNLAVSTATDELYVSEYCPPFGVTVLDIPSGKVTTATDPSAVNQFAIAVNPVTNKIYVANMDNCGTGPCDNFGSITVVDVASNSTTNIYDPVVFGPHGIAVNSSTNKIYVSNFSTTTSSNDGGVTILDGITNSFIHVTDPNAQTGGCYGPVVDNLAVDPATANVYVANFCSSNITVINGLTNTPTTLADPNAAGPVAVAVNPTTDKIYVVNGSSNNVTVIDGGAGATNVTLSISLLGAGSSGGTVTSVPTGISCPGTCSTTFNNGTSVSLTASAASPSTFAVWTGACAGKAACNVTMSANEDVTATFGSSKIGVSLSPSPANIQENAAQLFTANVAGDSKNLGVTWSVSATCNSGPVMPACWGALSPASSTTAGYSAPNGSIGTQVTVSATSVADTNKSASVTFTIATGPAPDFSLSAQYAQLTLPTGLPNEVLDKLTVAPGPNFAGTVQLSCAVTGSSPLPTCDAGGSGTIGNGGTWTPFLTVQAPAPAKASQGRHDILQVNPQLARFVLVAWLPLILGVTLLQRSKKRRAWQAAGFVPLLLLGFCSCGGSSQTQTQTPPVYTVTVTGTSTATSTSGAYQHTIQVTVTLQ